MRTGKCRSNFVILFSSLVDREGQSRRISSLEAHSLVWSIPAGHYRNEGIMLMMPYSSKDPQRRYLSILDHLLLCRKLHFAA
jgi:hypothetical protein